MINDLTDNQIGISELKNFNIPSENVENFEKIIEKTINDTLGQYILKPYGFIESRQNHEVALHYLFYDNFLRNYREFKYLFRYEYPTFQTYKREKIGKCSTPKLKVHVPGTPGYIDIAFIKYNEDPYQIQYGIEFALFDCNTNVCDVKIHTDNDIFKLSDKTNNVSNKILIYFFRCKDFQKTTINYTKDRIDTIFDRVEKFHEILFARSNQIHIIFIELYVLNKDTIKKNVKDYHNMQFSQIVNDISETTRANLYEYYNVPMI